jgi:hypothetical protein
VARSNGWADHSVDARSGTQTIEADPALVTMPFEIGGDRLTVTLDDDLQIADSERTNL